MILKGSNLFFAKDECSEPHGVIDLCECISVKQVKEFDFEVSSSTEKFVLRGSTRKEVEHWMNAIRGAISNCLSKQEYLMNYRAVLVRGQMFEKHHNDTIGRFNLKGNKENSRLVKISPDGQRIVWSKPGMKDVYCDSINLNTVLAINPGFTTNVLKMTGDKKKEANYFSVIAKERTLDLEASTPNLARQWVEGLRATLKYGTILSPTELHNQDQALRRKEGVERERRTEALNKHEADRSKLRAARERANYLNQQGRQSGGGSKR